MWATNDTSETSARQAEGSLSNGATSGTGAEAEGSLNRGEAGRDPQGVPVASADGTTPSERKFLKELSAGTVALVLLALLAGTSEALYGYQIAKRLESQSRNGLPVKQGTLYPVLRSLEAQGLLASTVEPSVSGPPRRYYSITAPGRTALVAWKDAWTNTRDFVDAVLEGHIG